MYFDSNIKACSFSMKKYNNSGINAYELYFRIFYDAHFRKRSDLIVSCRSAGLDQ